VLCGKYVLGDCIGSGGMGRVYRAHQPSLGRTVAIKVMHPALAQNPHVARHFRTEALAAAGIKHPNSVAVLDHGETDDGTPFLVMELVEGTSLARMVREEAPLDPRRAVTLILQVLDALEEAHRVGVIHADVKSDNVLVEVTRDGHERAKLADFGLARIAREPAFLDDADIISGTPEYMAPEIIEGAPPSRASDIYAAGALLYELLTGATPFAGGTQLDVMHRHANDVVVPPSLRVPELAIPRHVDNAVVTALSKLPARRFDSAAAFANALTSVAAQPTQRRARRCVPNRPPPDDVITLVLGGDEARRAR
jgi:serine/threonine protein kinase